VIVPYDFTPVLGGDKSVQFSPARLRNVYMTKSESNGRIAWHDLPGLKPFGTGTDADRGSYVFADERYLVQGTVLYKENAYGVRTSLGSVLGDDRATFSDDGTILAIVANNTLYKYNGVSVTTVSQSVITNPSWITFTNNTFIMGGDGQKFATSDTGDLDTWNALNFATADERSDDLIRGYVFQGLIYLFGSSSTESWYYSGTGNPPVNRRGSSLQDIGIAGKHAVTNSDAYIYWLGDDRRVYKGVGVSSTPVNTSSVSEIIEGYNQVSDCIMSSYTIKGQVFVLLKFTSAGDALLYSETNDYWVTLSSGTDRYTRAAWIGNSVQFCYNKNLVTDAVSGNTYEMDFDTYTDNGEARLRILAGNPINGAMIGVPQNQITFSSMVIPMQTGVGLATGQGSDPEIICEISPDGGQVFESEDFVSIGVMGDYNKKVKFDHFTTGYEIVPRVMISDPVPFTVYTGGSVDINDAGY
jgi:hypothetical protein